ncbi:MAG: hypothetical protein JWO42_2006, partial [Chloroflexi bacterium]|nr:hypothetical protein [Chloroflexota bacterium]
MLSNKYTVVSSAMPGLVEAWSSQRLPFEPKGWLADFRNDLRQTVRTLRIGPSRILHAVYASNDPTRCDAENILFYNIGSAAFSSVDTQGVRFERAFDCPEPPSPTDPSTHYVAYAIGRAGDSFIYWTERRTLAAWSDLAISPFTSSLRPASAWYWLKTGRLHQLDHLNLIPSQYGLSITLT